MDKTWVSGVYNKILAKEKEVAQRSRDKIPYTTINGTFDDKGKTDICWWTNGFWGGMMWQLYYATKEPVYLENALATEIKLDANLMNRQGMDHDSGFKWLRTWHRGTGRFWRQTTLLGGLIRLEDLSAHGTTGTEMRMALLQGAPLLTV